MRREILQGTFRKADCVLYDVILPWPLPQGIWAEDGLTSPFKAFGGSGCFEYDTTEGSFSRSPSLTWSAFN